MVASRRTFLFSSSASALGLVSPRCVSGANDRVGLALVGLNGMGMAHLKALLPRADVDVVALCDLDPTVLARAAKAVRDAGRPEPRLASDFRRLLDDPKVAALLIATPHHWHMPIGLRALAAGKDIYVEKPASHVFREGRLLVDLAAREKRVVQHGTQMRSSNVTKAAAEVLASGVLGEIKMAKAWNCQRQEDVVAVPDSAPPPGVDYDMWLGPAPRRPFNTNRFHRSWRVFRDYGNGDIGDDGAHDIDLARWGLGEVTHPVRITAHGSRVDLTRGVREYPDNMTVTYQYASGKVLIYEDRQWTPYGLHGVDSGNAFYGTKGYMLFSRRGYFETFIGTSEERGPSAGRRGRVGTPLPDHLANFIDCVRSRKTTNAPADVIHLSCGLVHLGEIAYRTGRVLHFDPKAERFGGDDEANGLLTKSYRRAWRV